MLLVLNLPLVGLWVQILKISMLYLYAGILVFATIGTYGISRSVFDLALLYGIGVLGFFMRRSDFPTSPVVIGMILRLFAEQQFRRAMTISQGDHLSVFVSRPISAALLLLALLAIMLPALMHLRRQRRQYPVDAD